MPRFKCSVYYGGIAFALLFTTTTTTTTTTKTERRRLCNLVLFDSIQSTTVLNFNGMNLFFHLCSRLFRGIVVVYLVEINILAKTSLWKSGHNDRWRCGTLMAWNLVLFQSFYVVTYDFETGIEFSRVYGRGYYPRK